MGTGGLFLRKIRARVADEPTGFVWIEKNRVAGSGYPASRSQVEWLSRAGVESILSLTTEPVPRGWTDGLGLTLGHVPMEDHEAPAVDALESGVDFIVEQLASGRPVAVHCLAGEGRTGCVLSAYLIATRGIGAGEALMRLRSVKPRFVEARQEKAVYEFALKHSQSGKN